MLYMKSPEFEVGRIIYNTAELAAAGDPCSNSIRMHLVILYICSL